MTTEVNPTEADGAQEQQMEDASERKRYVRYPAIALPKAVEYARTLHAKESLSPVPTEMINSHFGLSAKNSKGRLICAALVQYGLAEYPKRGQLAVTRAASTIISFPKDSREALQEAALKPELFREIRNRFGDTMPSEGNLARSLHQDFGFRERASRIVARNYRETLSFAGLGGVTPPGKASGATSPESDAQSAEEEKEVSAESHQETASGDFHNIELNLEEGPALIRIPRQCSPASQRMLVKTIEAITGYSSEAD